jgi:hypothetical protein
MQFLAPILTNLLDASGLRHPLDLPLGRPRGFLRPIRLSLLANLDAQTA